MSRLPTSRPGPASNGGNGYLRIMKFVPKENRIYVTTYSPILKENKTGERHEFVLEYEMVN